MNSNLRNILRFASLRPSYWVLVLISPPSWLLYIGLFGPPHNWILYHLTIFIFSGFMFLNELSSIRNKFIPEPQITIGSLFKNCFAYYFKLLVIVFPVFGVYAALFIFPSMKEMKIEDGSHWKSMIRMAIIAIPIIFIMISGFVVTIRDNVVASYKELFTNLKEKISKFGPPLIFLMALNGFAYVRQTVFQLADIKLENIIALRFMTILDVSVLYIMMFFGPTLLVHMATLYQNTLNKQPNHNM